MDSFYQLDKSRLEFVPMGSVLNPRPGILALDVGNHFEPGVMDHHQPGAPGKSTAGLVASYPEKILEYLQGVAPEKVRFVVHQQPDFDCVASLYLALHLVHDQKLPELSRSLAELADSIDKSYFPSLESFEKSPYGIFYGIVKLLAESTPEAEADFKTVNCGLEFIDALLAEAGKNSQTNLWKVDLSGRYQDEWIWCSREKQLYQEDRAAAEIYPISLPAEKQPGRREDYRLMVCRNPRSTLFKIFARNDSSGERSHQGFATLVNFDDKRFVISISPDLGLNLRGLGDELQRRETARRKALGKEITGKPRPGYDSPDPWYDGRNELHFYTIIDTPRAGTMLEPREVINTTLKFAHPWQTVRVKSIQASIFLLFDLNPDPAAGNRGQWQMPGDWERQEAFVEKPQAQLFYPYVEAFFRQQMQAGRISIYEKSFDAKPEKFSLDVPEMIDGVARYDLFQTECRLQPKRAQLLMANQEQMLIFLTVDFLNASGTGEFDAAGAVEVRAWLERSLKNPESKAWNWVKSLVPMIPAHESMNMPPFFFNQVRIDPGSWRSWQDNKSDILEALVSEGMVMEAIPRGESKTPGCVLSIDSCAMSPSGMTLAETQNPFQSASNRQVNEFLGPAIRLALFQWHRLVNFSLCRSRLQFASGNTSLIGIAERLREDLNCFVNGCWFSKVSPIAQLQKLWQALSENFSLDEQFDRTVKIITEIDEMAILHLDQKTFASTKELTKESVSTQVTVESLERFIIGIYGIEFMDIIIKIYGGRYRWLEEKALILLMLAAGVGFAFAHFFIQWSRYNARKRLDELEKQKKDSP